eukprot:Nk52_evm9s2171 gene=Nk52_evmTU9s2171
MPEVASGEKKESRGGCVFSKPAAERSEVDEGKTAGPRGACPFSKSVTNAKDCKDAVEIGESNANTSSIAALSDMVGSLQHTLGSALQVVGVKMNETMCMMENMNNLMETMLVASIEIDFKPLLCKTTDNSKVLSMQVIVKNLCQFPVNDIKISFSSGNEDLSFEQGEFSPFNLSPYDQKVLRLNYKTMPCFQNGEWCKKIEATVEFPSPGTGRTLQRRICHRLGALDEFLRFCVRDHDKKDFTLSGLYLRGVSITTLRQKFQVNAKDPIDAQSIFVMQSAKRDVIGVNQRDGVGFLLVPTIDEEAEADSLTLGVHCLKKDEHTSSSLENLCQKLRKELSFSNNEQ